MKDFQYCDFVLTCFLFGITYRQHVWIEKLWRKWLQSGSALSNAKKGWKAQLFFSLNPGAWGWVTCGRSYSGYTLRSSRCCYIVVMFVRGPFTCSSKRAILEHVSVSSSRLLHILSVNRWVWNNLVFSLAWQPLWKEFSFDKRPNLTFICH